MIYEKTTSIRYVLLSLDFWVDFRKLHSSCEVDANYCTVITLMVVVNKLKVTDVYQ